MRAQFISLLILSILTVSCKKESQPNATGLSGTWELSHIESGYRLNGSTADLPAGYKFQWKFTDSTYESIEHGSVIKQGFFGVLYGIGKPQLILDRDTNSAILFDLNGIQLILYRGIIAADGDIETYTRLQ
jgi:hypothetical protein